MGANHVLLGHLHLAGIRLLTVFMRAPISASFYACLAWVA